MLDLTGVRLRPDSTPFDHSFAAGEVCVVLGANLAGKTDLCRLIAGLATQAAAQQMVFDGRPVTDATTAQSRAALVYQAFVNYPNWTVAENIASPMRARGDDRRTVAARVGQLAGALQLSDLLARFPHELSGGQQQRVALARALAKDADILVLDQPLVNLDYKLREVMQAELKALLHDSKTIVVYTTSEAREAFALGDEVILLESGERLQAGSPLEIYQDPSSLAAMDLMSEPRANRTSDGRGVRPEHASLAALPGGRVYDLEVVGSETNGSESFVHGFCEGDDWVVHADGIVSPQPGETIPVHVREADIHDFKTI